MIRKGFWVFMFALILALTPSMLSASTPNHLIVLTVHQPVAVPKGVLQPGVYDLRFNDENLMTVCLTRHSDQALVGLYSVMPDYRPEPTDHTVVEVNGNGSLDRIADWFEPGSDYGWAFSYAHARAPMVASADSAIVTGGSQ